MEEVPASEESLLALDEQPALTDQNEEGLLIRLGVVNDALAGLEDGHIDPKLRELDRRLTVLVGEPTRRAPRLRREPLGMAHVDDKPTLRDGGKPGASVLKPRFVHAADSRSPSDGCLACASVQEDTPRPAIGDHSRGERNGRAKKAELASGALVRPDDVSVKYADKNVELTLRLLADDTQEEGVVPYVLIEASAEGLKMLAELLTAV